MVDLLFFFGYGRNTGTEPFLGGGWGNSPLCYGDVAGLRTPRITRPDGHPPVGWGSLLDFLATSILRAVHHLSFFIF